MKTTFLCALLLAAPACLCLADVAVYNGSQVVKVTSLDDTSTTVEKFIEVIDLANAKVVTITLDIRRGSKTFFVNAPLDVVKTQVQSSRGGKRTFTVLARASTNTDTTTTSVAVTSFLQQGLNGNVTIKGTEKVLLPRSMQGFESFVSTAAVSPSGGASAAAAQLVEIKSTVVLQEAPSRQSNNAGDTLAAAVDRIKAGLIEKGFGDGSVTPQP